MACGAGCWLPHGVSDPTPLPPQYLLGHWFLSRSLPQIFSSEMDWETDRILHLAHSLAWQRCLGAFTLTVLGQTTAPLALWLRRPPRERKMPGSNPPCAGIFPGSSHTSDLKIGIPVATLPGAWLYRVSAGTGWPDVSVL